MIYIIPTNILIRLKIKCLHLIKGLFFSDLPIGCSCNKATFTKSIHAPSSEAPSTDAS